MALEDKRKPKEIKPINKKKIIKDKLSLKEISQYEDYQDRQEEVVT